MAPTRAALRSTARGVRPAAAALAALTLLAALLATAPSHAETRVLLIGVGAYSRLPPDDRLAAPARDLVRLSASLIAAGVSPGAIETVSDARRGEGGRAAILAAMDGLVARAGAGDRVLLYYSGHGGQRPASRPDREADGLEEVWLAGDAEIAADGQPRGGLIADHEVVAVVSRLMRRGADVWLVVDACYAGGVTRGGEGTGAARVKAVGRRRLRAQAQPEEGGGGIGPGDGAATPQDAGRFTAFYAAGAGSPALATDAGSLFTGALARAIDSGRVASLRDLAAGVLATDSRLGADAPRPVFEGDLDRPVLDLAPGRPRRFALRRSGPALTLLAGREEGVRIGSVVTLEDAQGGDLGRAVVDRVGLASARLAGPAPAAAVAGRPEGGAGPDAGEDRPADRILAAIAALGGRWSSDTLKIAARLERARPGACLEAADPEAPGPEAGVISLTDPPLLHDCDRLFVAVTNSGTTTLDVSLLYLAADGSVVGPSLHPLDEVRLRPGERRTAAVRIVSEPEAVVERLAVLAVPAASRFPLDLRYLVTPVARGDPGPASDPSDPAARWWREMLGGRPSRGGEGAATPVAVPVAVAFPLGVVP